MAELSDFRLKIKSCQDLVGLLAAKTLQKKRTVLASGCFDILHYGHLLYLDYARGLGDILIVSLNDDASIRKLKGPERPYMNQEQRTEIIAALVMVDYVVLFPDDTAATTIEMLRPAIFVKGKDYQYGDVLERSIVEGYGGKVVIAQTEKTHSSSSMSKAFRSNKDEDIDQP